MSYEDCGNASEDYNEELLTGCVIFFASPFIQLAAMGFEGWWLSNKPQTPENIVLSLAVPIVTAAILYAANHEQMGRVADYNSMENLDRG